MCLYEGVVWRPPSEAHSLILQATVGCSWNRCTFCPPYKDKQFRVRGFDEFKRHTEEVSRFVPRPRRIFLADGNALCMGTPFLLEELTWLYGRFPSLERVSIYGGPLDVIRKSSEELNTLREHGLGMIYLGLESGSDAVLRMVKKGADSSAMVEAAKKVKDAGIKLSVIFILGLGGKERSLEHARETARVLTLQDPDYAAALSLMVVPGTEMYETVKKGELTVLSPKETLEELRVLVKGLRLSNCVFRANHASNYVPMRGHFPEDKEALLRQIDEALEKGDFKPSWMRGL